MSGMGRGWVVGLGLAMGCATTPPVTTVVSVETQRVALASPLTLWAAPGLGLGARVVAGLPRAPSSSPPMVPAEVVSPLGPWGLLPGPPSTLQ